MLVPQEDKKEVVDWLAQQLEAATQGVRPQVVANLIWTYLCDCNQSTLAAKLTDDLPIYLDEDRVPSMVKTIVDGVKGRRYKRGGGGGDGGGGGEGDDVAGPMASNAEPEEERGVEEEPYADQAMRVDEDDRRSQEGSDFQGGSNDNLNEDRYSETNEDEYDHRRRRRRRRSRSGSGDDYSDDDDDDDGGRRRRRGRRSRSRSKSPPQAQVQQGNRGGGGGANRKGPGEQPYPNKRQKGEGGAMPPQQRDLRDRRGAGGMPPFQGGWEGPRGGPMMRPPFVPGGRGSAFGSFDMPQGGGFRGGPPIPGGGPMPGGHMSGPMGPMGMGVGPRPPFGRPVPMGFEPPMERRGGGPPRGMVGHEGGQPGRRGAAQTNEFLMQGGGGGARPGSMGVGGPRPGGFVQPHHPGEYGRPLPPNMMGIIGGGGPRAMMPPPPGPAPPLINQHAAAGNRGGPAGPVMAPFMPPPPGPPPPRGFDQRFDRDGGKLRMGGGGVAAAGGGGVVGQPPMGWQQPPQPRGPPPPRQRPSGIGTFDMARTQHPPSYQAGGPNGGGGAMRGMPPIPPGPPPPSSFPAAKEDRKGGGEGGGQPPPAHGEGTAQPPQQEPVGLPEAERKTLKLTSVPTHISRKVLQDHFSYFSRVVAIKFEPDPSSPSDKPSNVAYVQLATHAAAQKSLNNPASVANNRFITLAWHHSNLRPDVASPSGGTDIGGGRKPRGPPRPELPASQSQQEVRVDMSSPPLSGPQPPRPPRPSSSPPAEQQAANAVNAQVLPQKLELAKKKESLFVTMTTHKRNVLKKLSKAGASAEEVDKAKLELADSEAQLALARQEAATLSEAVARIPSDGTTVQVTLNASASPFVPKGGAGRGGGRAQRKPRPLMRIDNRTTYVKIPNLPADVSAPSMQSVASNYGPVEDVVVENGAAIIKFGNRHSAEKAMAAIKFIGEAAVTPEWYDPRIVAAEEGPTTVDPGEVQELDVALFGADAVAGVGAEGGKESNTDAGDKEAPGGAVEPEQAQSGEVKGEEVGAPMEVVTGN